MITAEFSVSNNKPLVIITSGVKVIGIYIFDIVDFNIFEPVVKGKPRCDGEFMLCFDSHFKLFADVLLLSYEDRVIRLEPFNVTTLEVRGFYGRWFKERCKE